MQPLTHHQIIGLVEPFTRRGRHVDLAASNRLERWLVFKPVEHEAGLRETLKLENAYDGYFRLTRRLHRDNGLEASLVAEGADAGELLRRIEAVPPQRQFSSGAGFETALSFRLDASNMILTDAVARFAG